MSHRRKQKDVAKAEGKMEKRRALRDHNAKWRASLHSKGLTFVPSLFNRGT